ncbi:unnamed protein product, partial [Ixodes hexagonus]
FYVVSGLGIGITTMALSILLAMYFDKYRGLTSGIKYAGLSCGGLVFPKFLAHLQRTYGFRGALLIHGGLAMHVSAVGLVLKEPPWISLTKSEEGVQEKNDKCSVGMQNTSANVAHI